MKRTLVIVPLVLLVLLNACDTGRVPPLSEKQWNTIALTEQVRNKSSEDKLKYWLIDAQPQPDNVDQLEQLLFAQYTIRSISLQQKPYFTVDMYCQCKNGSCCHAEEMLILLLRRITGSQFRDQIVAEVDASSAQYLDLVTSDQVAQLAAIYAPWDIVRRFIQGSLQPYELVNQIQIKSLR